MIAVKRIRDVKYEDYDEVWAVVRSMKNPSPKMKQVQALSPQLDLFFEYRRLAVAGQWNRESFQNIYVPKFLEGMVNSTEGAADKLNELWQKDKAGLRICLACFCTDEDMCHRSILAGLLQGAGCSVVTETGKDYSGYYAAYRTLSGIP